MYSRLLTRNLSRKRPFCIIGAKGVGKTMIMRDFSSQFSNWIHLDLETMVDRAIFNFDASSDETLKAISFLKGREIRGKGTLIVLDEIGKCPGAMKWFWGQGDKGTRGQGDEGTGGRADGPLVIATSSIMTKELKLLISAEGGNIQPQHLYPLSFEEFLMALDDQASLEAFREVPVPYYAYEKLLNYFHLYSLIGGMPEITSEYALNRHLSGLKKIYEKIEARFIDGLTDVTPGLKSRNLAVDVLQNTYPYAATRIRLNHFGNLEKGSREIGQAFKAAENACFLQMVYPVTSEALPMIPDTSKFPRLQILDTGLVNYFSGIQKPLFQSHDMNAIFEGQIARQVVGQEIIATEGNAEGVYQPLNFWLRNKAQSRAEVDFIILYNDLLIPVVVKSGEPGRLRSLHQFIDLAPHAYAVRLYAGKLAVQQTRTIRGKKFYLMNLPYFLAGKIREHLGGFRKYVEG
jgi:uncharacterized protein